MRVGRHHTEVTAPRAPSPRLGYALAATAAALWGLNGSLARFLLDDGLPSARLAELRSVFTALVLLGVLAAVRPGAMRVRRADPPRVALLGVGGAGPQTPPFFIRGRRL